VRGKGKKEYKGGQYIQIKELGIGGATLLWDRQSTGYPPQLKTFLSQSGRQHPLWAVCLGC